MERSAEKPAVRKRWYTRLMDLYRYSPVPVPVLAPAIRWAFRRRAARHVRKIAALPVDRDALEGWYREHPVFFGFAVPRSGSTFLADFLNEALPDDVVQHEANVVDYYHYPEAIADPDAARAYVETYRLKEIYVRMRPYSFRGYGEINPFLRRHCRAIRELLPGAPTFHLVRDGRRALRSLMSREILAPTDPLGPLVLPPPGDPWRERWPRMSRFERLCWMWQADNQYIRQNTDRSVQFERLVSEYGYFRDHLLAHLGLEVEEPVWRDRVARVVNPTPRQRVPRYADWPPGWKATFERICGDEMAASGYRD